MLGEGGMAAVQFQELTHGYLGIRGLSCSLHCPSSASAVGGCGNSQKGNCRGREGESASRRRSACDARQIIQGAQSKRTAIQPHGYIPQVRRIQGVPL